MSIDGSYNNGAIHLTQALILTKYRKFQNASVLLVIYHAAVILFSSGHISTINQTKLQSAHVQEGLTFMRDTILKET